MGPMGNEGTGGMGYRGMGHRGYGVQGVWVTSAMGHMGNGVQGYGQWGAWAICTQNVKKMSSCQKDVKCQKIKHLDYGGGSQKN